MKRHSIFLQELLMVILFFALCAAVCVRLFAGAYTINRHTGEQTQVQQIVQNAAEIVRSDPAGAQAALLANMPGAAADGLGVLVKYDTNWMPTEQNEAYSLSVVPAVSAGKVVTQFSVKKADGTELYTTSLTTHIRRQV